jgi:hypothetical protein
MIARIGRVLWLASCIITAPVALAHEASHYAVAQARADEAAFEVEVFGGRAATAWTPLESRLWRAFAFLAPTVFGTLLGLLWLVSGVSLDGWRLVMFVGLALYTLPSPADVRGAAGLQRRDSNNG